MIVKVQNANQLKCHLEDRHMNLDLHNVILSDQVATILLYNLSGQLVGYQRYNPSFPSAFPGDGKQSNLRDRRYYNYVSEGKIGLFGLESFHLNSPCVFVTEGVFDACRLTKRGACAVAMLTNTPSSSMKNFLRCLAKPLIAICDNDAAGRKLRSVGHYYETVQEGKDLGECPEDFVDFLLAKYC
jgi:hypothetical protein